MTFGSEQGRGSPAAVQAIHALGIVAHHGVAQRLAFHPGDPGGSGA